MPEYKDYELVGGRPVKISPFDAEAAGEGVHFAKEGCAFNPVIVSGGGGGNPNYVETITGTLANPWGEVSTSDLSAEIVSSNASAYLDVDATALGMGVAHLVATPYAGDSVLSLQAIGGTGSLSSDWMCVLVDYGVPSGTLIRARILSEGNVTDASPYASAIPTVLTIVHHPLPEEP